MYPMAWWVAQGLRAATHTGDDGDEHPPVPLAAVVAIVREGLLRDELHPLIAQAKRGAVGAAAAAAVLAVLWALLLAFATRLMLTGSVRGGIVCDCDLE